MDQEDKNTLWDDIRDAENGTPHTPMGWAIYEDYWKDRKKATKDYTANSRVMWRDIIIAFALMALIGYIILISAAYK